MLTCFRIQLGLTSCILVLVQEDAGDRQYHIVITAQGTATHWQARVHYYWYKKVHAVCAQHMKAAS